MDQPKVRFSQASDSFVAHAGDEHTVPNKSKGKVKIKSIVPTAYPVKVLKNGHRVLLKDQKSNLEINKKQNSSSSVSGCSKFDSSVSSIPVIYVSEEHNSQSKNEYENVNNPNTALDDQNVTNIHKIVKNTHDNLEECIDKLQHFSFQYSSTQNCAQQTGRIREQDQECESLQSSKNDSFKSCLDEDSDIEVIQVIENPNPLTSFKTNKICTDNKKVNFKKENKENKSIKGKFLNNQQNCNKTKILKDTTNPSSNKNKNVPSKRFVKSQNKVQLMPCAKFREASLSKNKSAGKGKKEKEKEEVKGKKEREKEEVKGKKEKEKEEVKGKKEKEKGEVKKSMVYHIASSHNNVSVEPGTFHKKCSHPASNDLEKSEEKRNIASEDLLSRPEYNSTVCVMKKLKKLENEKFVTDFQHLPQEYKNLIYGKVSAGLDVGPYESVYKDLINISVDDNKLPARLMRSKDPEPRDKDIVPQISDFYQPKYAEQYFVIANPVVPRPGNLSTLSAFTISNKICAWKSARDNF